MANLGGLQSTKFKEAGHTRKGFFLIELFEIGKSTLDLGHVFWFNAALKKKKRCRIRKLFSFCLLVLTLAGTFIYPAPKGSLSPV